ncbi:MAG TPA: tetratricopeptide repeat protein [Phycisphaerales bacterium]|nr:tetratricopeptide repeat protein [Phycisphaerales bacterium]
MTSKRKGRDAARQTGRDSRRRKLKDRSERATAGQPQQTRPPARVEKPKKSRPPIARRRLWAYRLVAATVIPIALLVLVEIALRLGGYGYPTTATLRYSSGGTARIVNNERFGWRFFPPSIARELEPFSLPAAKPRDSYRIFVLGSSAAQGIPDASFNIGRILEVMLEAEHPDVDFEVATVAMSAVNSHVVRVVAQDLARHDPDMFVVYLGNNEVVGPYGPGGAFGGLSGRIGLIRASIALKSLRLGQLIAAAGLRRGAPTEWSGMEIFSDKQIRHNDRRLEAVYSHFRSNLSDIRDAALATGARVVLSTVGVNLEDCAPFSSLHEDRLTSADIEKWQALYDAGVAHEQAGRWAEACEQYAAAEAIDAQYADLHFRLGRCLWQQGHYAQAADRFIRARNLDTLRFRADSRINAVIREVAAVGKDGWVALADAEGALAQAEAEQTPGEESFWEHVHLNMHGNYVVARAVFEQVHKMLPASLADKALGQEPADEAYCREKLAYTDWDEFVHTREVLNGFLRRAPFTNQLYHNEQIARFETQLAELDVQMKAGGFVDAAERHKAAIGANPGDWRIHYKYGKLLAEDMKDYKAAADEYRTVVGIIGHSHMGYESLGAVLRALGDIRGMMEQYEQALERKPTSVDALYYLGWGHQKQGRLPDAERYYRRVIQLRPAHAPAYNNLGEVLYKQNRLEDAVQACRDGLAVDPNNAILHSNLGVLLDKLGFREEAIRQLHTAERLDPNSARIKAVLKDILKQN